MQFMYSLGDGTAVFRSERTGKLYRSGPGGRFELYTRPPSQSTGSAFPNAAPMPVANPPTLSPFGMQSMNPYAAPSAISSATSSWVSPLPSVLSPGQLESNRQRAITSNPLVQPGSSAPASLLPGQRQWNPDTDNWDYGPRPMRQLNPQEEKLWQYRESLKAPLRRLY